MTHRFFVPDVPADEAVIEGDQARQIATVLRLAAGERVILVAGGIEHEVVIERVAARRVTGRVVARRAVRTEPPFRLTLALPVLKGDRSEEVIEAASQLGVWRFVPFVSARSVAKGLSAAKLERWQRIAREAAETARRAAAPVVEPAVRFQTLADRLDGAVLVCWEEATEPHLGTQVVSGPCSLVIGPEGGLGADEVAGLGTRGARAFSLGPRNLRAETAAIAAVALLIGTAEARG